MKLFQQYLTKYQIIVVSGDHNDSIIYPPKPPDTGHEKQIISLYFHNKHFDVITSIPGFLNKSYFCHRCHKTYSNTCDHFCQGMCRSCRAFGCVLQGDGIACNECGRLFKNQACYDHHKEPVNSGGRSVCQVIRKRKECGKAVAVNHMNGHVCGKKCRTCGVILKREDDEHQCYMQQLEQGEERVKKDTIAIFQPDRQLKIKQTNMTVKWLSYVMKEEDIHIQHARNGGEKRFMKCSLDGYCKETHTVYAFQDSVFCTVRTCNVMYFNF